MALTFDKIQAQSAGSEGKSEFDIICDTSYPSGGYNLRADRVSLFRVNRLNIPDTSFAILDLISGQTLITYVKAFVSYPDAFTANIRLFNGQFAPNVQEDSFSNILGATNANSENVDAAAPPLNATAIAPTSTVAAGAWTVGAITPPDCLRNVCIVIENNTAGALNLFQGVMTFTVIGKINGVTVSELITFTSSAGNKSIAMAQNRFKYGVQPFDSITSVTLNNVPDNGLDIAVGIGSKIGIVNPLNSGSGLAADVIKVSLNAADVTAAVTIDPFYATRGVTFTALANGDDVDITYRAAGGEIAVGADLSSVRLKAEMYGY